MVSWEMYQTKMKISLKKLLYITAYPPNHKSGGQVFSCNAIKDLSSKYEVDLIYFDFPEHEMDRTLPIHKHKKYIPSKINCLNKPWYFPLFTKRFSVDVLEMIKKIKDNYDILLFDHSQVAIYSMYLKHACKIIRCHDVMAQKYMRMNSYFHPWVVYTERKVLKSADKVFVPSLKDAKIVRNYYKIKAEYTNEYILEYEIKNKEIECDGFVLFGRWGRNENTEGLIWFCREVCPCLNESFRKSIVVMGGDLSEKIVRKWLMPNGIKYLGYVEDSYGEIFKRKAMIAPVFKGAGVKVKILDAFATGTYVIGTDISFEGIPYNRDLMIVANSSEDFINRINTIQHSKISVIEKRKQRDKFKAIYNNRHLSDFL